MKVMQSVCALLCAMVIGTSSAIAATTIYTDRAAFDIATGGSLSFEDFSDAAFNNLTIQTDAGFVANGLFNDRPTPDTATQTGARTTFDFGTSINAFGANYDLSPNGAGNGLRFVLGTGEIVSSEISAPYTGFWGFVSDLTFTTLTVGAGSGAGVAETHNFDSLSYGIAQPVAPVPVPAGLPLLVTAILGFVGFGRWARRSHALSCVA